MPVFRSVGPSHRPFLIVGLFCVCIVTVGFVRVTRGQGLENEKEFETVKRRVGMGHPSTSAEQLVAADESSEESDALHKYHSEFSNVKREKTLEERLLAKQSDGVMMEELQKDDHKLNNPHPQLSIPQLPFCKPTKTTVGSAGSKTSAEETKKGSGDNRRHSDVHGDGESRYGNNDDDDIEVINTSTSEGVVEADRKFLVATLDGKVTLLNRTGHQLWSLKTGPLFSSTISSLQLNENGKWINLIPSLTGGVYKYDGESLHPMPFNADSLLKKSFKLSNDVVITGGKELRTYGIDVKSGNIRYECGISGCKIPADSEVSGSAGEGNEDPVVLVVKKQLQTVRAIDSSTGAERWNFSVGTHELALAGVTEGCYHGEQRDSSGKTSDFLKIVIPEGRVFGADIQNRVVWDHQFEAPISQAWILENGQLVSVDPITNTPLTDVPSLYIGIHNQQFYVQESHSIAEKMEKYYGIDDATSLRKRPLNIAWKPTAAIDGVSGSTAISTISPRPTWVSFAPTPDFRPIYVYDRDSVGDNLEGPNSTEFDEDDDEEPPELDFGEGITQVIVMSLWYWWKEVLGISLLTAVLLNVILMKPIMRAVRSHTIREMSGYFQQLWNRWKEEEETRALLARHSSNLLSLPAPEENTDFTTDANRKRSTSSSSTGSLNSPCSEVCELQFSSQYLNEFIPIECLGRGGFGVVFEAKKKIDDRTYAVKRITLPDREKARVRVMREVKALAQLDHRNIVRYFNAWIESPPSGWLEKNDPLWARTLIGSTSPTMDYPSDMFGSSILPDSSRKEKPDHSQISVPDTPSEQPDDDSFIVFETSTTSTYSRGDWSSLETSSLLAKSTLEDEQESTSIRIPPSEASSASSVSGGGFFARRPTSLNIHSSLSSFHEEISHNRSAVEDEPLDKEKSSQGKDVEEEESICNLMYLYIQQELCQKRTLQDWLRSERSRELSLVVNLFSQIVEAVEYVHSKKLIHRDLKPSNIFLAEVTENGFGVLTVKIGDFGLATTAYAELESEKVVATPMDEANEGQAVRVNLTGHVGTHLYMSPEQYQRKPYDYKVDIYSLGLIFFELLVPFSTDMERYNTLSGVRKLKFPAEFTDLFPNEYDLIRTMISHNPNERPDAGKINTWVKSHILKVPDSKSASRDRGSGDAHVGRSISSPAKIVVASDENDLPENRKLKPRFYKTQSVM